MWDGATQRPTNSRPESRWCQASSRDARLCIPHLLQGRRRARAAARPGRISGDRDRGLRMGIPKCPERIGQRHYTLQHAFHPAIAEPDPVLAGQLLVKMPQIKIEILLSIEFQHPLPHRPGRPLRRSLPRLRSNSPRKPPSSYRSRHRRMCRSLMPMISAA